MHNERNNVEQEHFSKKKREDTGGVIFRFWALKRVSIFAFLVLKWGQGLRTFAAHPHPKFMGLPPPPLPPSNSGTFEGKKISPKKVTYVSLAPSLSIVLLQTL